MGIDTSFVGAAPLWRASSSSSQFSSAELSPPELDKTSKFLLAAIQQTNGLRMMAYLRPEPL